MGLLDDDYGIKGKLRALRDTAQSASNAIASNISGPVDLISMGLRGVGMPIPEDAIGGSKWMADRGLTKEVPMGAPRIIGETLGMAGPAVAAAKAPQIAAGLNQMQANAMAPNVLRKQSGMFIGPSAKTWDAEAAKQAQTMAARGADPRKIWSETGTFKGPDGKWRQEIDDSAARIDAHSMRYLESAQAINPLKTGKLSDVLTHRKVYGAYPDAQDIGVDLAYSKNGGAYAPKTEWGDPEQLAIGSVADPRSTALHELQHAIQHREGWAQGGSVDGMRGIISDAIDGSKRKANQLRSIAYRGDPLAPFDVVKPGALDKAFEAEAQMRKLQDWQSRLNAFPDSYGIDAYRSLAGEAEARATQARIPLTAEQRRAKFPLDSYDVPIESLILRGAQ